MTLRDLKLLALDADDLQVISASVQDAIVKADEIVVDAKASHIILPMRRYTWEDKSGARSRKNAVLRITRIQSVQTKGIHRNNAEQVLSLLSIGIATLDGKDIVSLTFADDIAMMIGVEALELELKDLGGSWSAVREPNHRL